MIWIIINFTKNIRMMIKILIFFSNFYTTKDKIYIITSLKSGILKKNWFWNFEIIDTENNGNFINCFCFLNVNYLFASTEIKK